MKPNMADLAAKRRRINALLSWWGIPRMAVLPKEDGQIKPLRRLAMELGAFYDGDDGWAREAGTNAVYYEMPPAEAGRGLRAAEAETLARLSDQVSRRARLWAEIMRRANEPARP